MKQQSTIWLFIIAVFVLPVTAFALLNWYQKKVERLPVLGKSKEHRIEEFTLINQDGNKYQLAQWKNKIVIADFFFTHCPSICPKMTKSMKGVQDAFLNEPDLLLSSFSVDPERDSAAQLRNYCRKQNIDTRNWQFLTGNKKDIYKLARNSFMIVATDGDGGPDDFIHSENLVLVDKQQRIRGYYDGTSNKEVNQLITDIKKLKHEN